MNFKSWQPELDVALGAVRDAAVLARDIRRQIGNAALMKEDRSPGTVADFAVQAVVARRLGEKCPGDPLVAEDGGPARLHARHRPPSACLTVSSGRSCTPRASCAGRTATHRTTTGGGAARGCPYGGLVERP